MDLGRVSVDKRIGWARDLKPKLLLFPGLFPEGGLEFKDRVRGYCILHLRTFTAKELSELVARLPLLCWIPVARPFLH